MKNKNYKRLDYDGISRLQEEFEINNLTCGFMRQFSYNSKTNKMKGFCFFREKAGLETECTNTVPFTFEDCKVYKKYSKQNQ